MAMTHVSKQIMMGNFQYDDMTKMDCKKMLVLSLGTGTGKHEEKYNATVASRWGMLGWVYNNGATPLIDIYGDASADMVDIHVSTMFQTLGSEKNYIRIQVRMTRFFLVFSKYMMNIYHLTFFCLIGTGRQFNRGGCIYGYCNDRKHGETCTNW